ncbi:MAG: hypothetical protein H0W96_04800, partial [Solirubrobacterales bacterium]|nr:hypothetical protein [Solirubrobacterales bacterium]
MRATIVTGKVPGVTPTFIFLMFVLKLPIFGLLYIVWWAIRSTPEPEPVTDDDDGGADESERHQGDSRRGQQVGEQPTADAGHAVGVIRMIDLLRQGFHSVEAEQVQGQPGRDEGRGGA